MTHSGRVKAQGTCGVGVREWGAMEMGSRPLGLGALLGNVRGEVIIIIIATGNEHGYDL